MFFSSTGQGNSSGRHGGGQNQQGNPFNFMGPGSDFFNGFQSKYQMPVYSIGAWHSKSYDGAQSLANQCDVPFLNTGFEMLNPFAYSFIYCRWLPEQL